MKKFFVLTFFIIIIMPIINISKKQQSYIEQRQLAKYKNLIINKNLNIYYARDLNNFLSDRFFLREILIKENLLIKYYLANDLYIINNRLINKKDLWGFEKNFFKILSLKNIMKTSIAVNDFNNYLKANNIKLYIIVSPYKALVYPDETKIYQKVAQYNNRIVEKFINIIRSSGNLKIIYTYNDLIKAKNENYVFFKMDSHLTDYGSYIVYKAIVKEIQKEYPSLKILTLDKYNISYNTLQRYDFKRYYKTGVLSNILPFSDSYIEKNFLKTLYKYYDYKNLNKADIKFDSAKGVKQYHMGDMPNIRVLLLGTSLNENILGFLPYSFSDLLYFRINSNTSIPVDEQYKLYKRYKKDIESFKPNIVIISINSENFLSNSKYFMMKD